MKNLLLVIAKGLVKNPEDVRVDVEQPNEKGVVVYRLYVAQSDVGRVIGKQGRIAKAIRMVMRSAASRKRCKVAVEIAE